MRKRLLMAEMQIRTVVQIREIDEVNITYLVAINKDSMWCKLRQCCDFMAIENIVNRLRRIRKERFGEVRRSNLDIRQRKAEPDLKYGAAMRFFMEWHENGRRTVFVRKMVF